MVYPTQENLSPEIFDFDKTLTCKDSTLGFFLFKENRCKQLFLYLVFYILAIGVALQLINRKQHKECLLNLFFGRCSQDALNQKAKDYAKTILFQSWTKTIPWTQGPTKWVITASWSAWVKPLFPENTQVIGSEFTKNTKQQWVVDPHTEGDEKVLALARHGIGSFGTVYTDSKRDAPLVKLSKQWVLVQPKGHVHGTDFKQFMRHA